MFYRNTAYKHHQTMTHPPLPKQNATGQTKAGINEEEFPKATHSSLPSSRATLNQLSHPPQKRCSRFQRGAHTGACAGRQAARGEEPRTARKDVQFLYGYQDKERDRGEGVPAGHEAMGGRFSAHAHIWCAKSTLEESATSTWHWCLEWKSGWLGMGWEVDFIIYPTVPYNLGAMKMSYCCKI